MLKKFDVFLFIQSREDSARPNKTKDKNTSKGAKKVIHTQKSMDNELTLRYCLSKSHVM